MALLDFQRGHMWQEQNELPRARRWFEAAIRRVPPFAPAQGHLAEVETRLGHVEVAIDRLRPLAASSDDPPYAAQLARLLGIAGPSEEALAWRARAAARFDELCVRHEAFAEHAAEFWLAVGDDPSRALDLAQSNAQLRATPRARELFARSQHRLRGGRPRGQNGTAHPPGGLAMADVIIIGARPGRRGRRAARRRPRRADDAGDARGVRRHGGE